MFELRSYFMFELSVKFECDVHTMKCMCSIVRIEHIIEPIFFAVIR